MKKIIMLIVAACVGLLALAGPAAATGNGGPVVEGKKQTICHFTNENASHQYNKIEVAVSSIVPAPTGHSAEPNDIIPAFDYYLKVDGEWVLQSFPGQGDTSLLAYDDCEPPAEDTPIAKPVPVALDPCVTKNDSFAVAPGTGYTVGPVVKDGLVWSITVTLLEGYKWTDGTKTPLVFEHTFTNVDCDLPDTGVGPVFNTTGGALALGGMVLVGGFTMMASRRRRLMS